MRSHRLRRFLFGIDQATNSATHARWRVVDRQLDVFPHAGLVLLLLDGGQDVAVLFKSQRVESRNVGLYRRIADAVVAQMQPEIMRGACGLRREEIVGE